jgi:serine/threonine protein kinase
VFHVTTVGSSPRATITSNLGLARKCGPEELSRRRRLEVMPDVSRKETLKIAARTSGVISPDMLSSTPSEHKNESRLADLGISRYENFDAGRRATDQDDAMPSEQAAMSTYKRAVFAVEVSQRSKRVHSPHVCARHYRPPEIILLEKEYTDAIDIWQFGVIFGEMLRVSEPYHSSGKKGKKMK